MSRRKPDPDLVSLHPVILGSEGRAGSVLADRISQAAPQTVAATRMELDITDYFNLRWELERLEADLVVNAAAWADVDACESDPEKAFRINAEAAGTVARAARECGARVVHLSTDYVFDGEKGTPCTESDPAEPLSVYGRSKRAGELLVRANHPAPLIVRTAWLFGGTGRRPDFMEGVLIQAAEGVGIPVASDQEGSPTGVEDLAAGILELVRVGATGIVHLTCSGEAGRVEFAEAVLDLGGHTAATVVPVESDRLQAPARRPRDSRLDITRFQELTGTIPRHWRDALRAVLAARREEA